MKEELQDGGIDVGLTLLLAVTPRGVTRTHGEIAYVCGCTRNAIWIIEQRALRKLRHPLRSQRLKEFVPGGVNRDEVVLSGRS